jgi:hypothetical protein
LDENHAQLFLFYLILKCAIRDNAETRIWERLKYLRHYKTKINVDTPPIVGVLGVSEKKDGNYKKKKWKPITMK